MKKLLGLMLILSCVVICSCNNDSQPADKYVCNCEEKAKLQEYVANSIKSANNMSDEEMEDVLAELRTGGIKMFCRQKQVYVFPNEFGKIDWQKTKLDSCESIMELY